MSIALTASVIVPTAVSNECTFSRASTATRVRPDGLLEQVATNVPRIDYDPITLACTGLLIEEARTNLLVYSEQLDNAAWISFGTVARMPNTHVAPDGTLTADSLAISPVSGIYQSLAAVPGQTYAVSFYIRGDSAQTIRAVSNTNLGEITSTTVVVTASWQRVTIIKPTTTGVLVNLQLDTSSTGAAFQVWGAQLEAGTFPTSYIPTIASAVTRAADVITGQGLVYCSTPEPATGETLWNAATDYTVGQVVARSTTHHRYENLIAGVDATLPEVAALATPKRWLDIGATNRWAQFDKKIGTATTSPGNLTAVVKLGSAEGLALLDLVGRSVNVNASSNGRKVFGATVSLDATVVESVYDWMFGDYSQKRNVVLTNLPGQYPDMEITVTVNSTTGAAIGVFAVGRVMLIGSTQYGAGAGIINFGKVSDDGFGNRTWIEGQWANRVTLPLVANRGDMNRIHRQLAGLRSTPCIYIGSELDDLEPLVCYGVYRDLYATVPDFSTIALNLEIDGMDNQ